MTTQKQQTVKVSRTVKVVGMVMDLLPAALMALGTLATLVFVFTR